MQDLGSGEGGNPCPLQWALGGLATGLPEKSLKFVFLPFPAFRGCPHSILEKEMATHCSVLAWRIPGMAEPGRLPSMGSHRVGHD